MKRFIVVAIAVFLLIPAISFAGSATSRWDLTLGGYVKFDMGWADQGVNADYAIAARDSRGAYESRVAEYSSMFAAGGEGRLWWIVKGPEAWGGKTSSYVEGDFRGQTGDYGEFSLRHAFMKIEWLQDNLTIGHTWQRWGVHGPFGGWLLDYAGLGTSLKGWRQPQIMWDHMITKSFGIYAGILSPTNTIGTRDVDDFARSGYPFIEAGIKYRSDSCGRIGMNLLYGELGGFYGQERKTFQVATQDVNGYDAYDDEMLDSWGVAAKFYVPIIPEKKVNKAGALGVGGTAFITQNPGWYQNIPSMYYNRNGVLDPDWAVPRQWGGWLQLDYWFTDKFSFHGWYSHLETKLSHRLALAQTASPAPWKNQQYIANLSYDVNPAMRFGIEYSNIRTKYAGETATSDKKGTMNTFRIGAWYFF